MFNDIANAFYEGMVSGDAEKVEACLARHPELATTTMPHSESPPLFATYSSDIAKLLLRHGADPNQRDDGLTPLLDAAKRGAVEVASALIEYGADLNADDGYGNSPLQYAIVQLYTSIVDLLLRKGAEYGVKPAVTRHDVTRLNAILNASPDAIRELPTNRQVDLLDNALMFLEPQFGGVGPREDWIQTVQLLFDNGLRISRERLQTMTIVASAEIAPILQKELQRTSE